MKSSLFLGFIGILVLSTAGCGGGGSAPSSHTTTPGSGSSVATQVLSPTGVTPPATNVPTQNTPSKSGDEPSTGTYDPCQISQPENAPFSEISSVYPNDLQHELNFQAEIAADPIQTLKAWLLTTSTFAKAKSIEAIEMVQLMASGVGHRGIYEFSLKDEPQTHYILKISKHEHEAEHLLRLQGTRVAHPECFLRTDLGLSRIATPEEIALFPRIPKVIEASTYPFTRPAGEGYSYKDSQNALFILVLEKASGVPLASLDLNPAEKMALYKTLGKSLGYFHSFLATDSRVPFKTWKTWRHGDLHANNVFIDRTTGEITFIDNDSMEPVQKTTSLRYDHSQLTYGVFSVLLNSDDSFRNQFTKAREEAAKKQGLKVNFMWAAKEGKMHPYDAGIAALNDPALMEEVHQSSPYKNLSDQFELFYVMAQGYLEAMPQEVQNDVRKFFGKTCRETAQSFMRDYSHNIASRKDPLEPELLAGMKNLFPPKFNDCWSENRFGE